MGESSDYPHVKEWKPGKRYNEDGKTPEMVKYKGNIFVADWWSGSAPGESPKPNGDGWAFYDELYDITAQRQTKQAKIIGYIPTWRRHEGFDFTNSEIYQYITHGIIAFLMFDESRKGRFATNSLSEVNAVLPDIVNVGHRSDTKILIALGGAIDYGFLYLMEEIGANPSSSLLSSTVRRVVEFVNNNNPDCLTHLLL